MPTWPSDRGRSDATPVRHQEDGGGLERYIRSMTIAGAMPPPAHMVMRP